MVEKTKIWEKRHISYRVEFQVIYVDGLPSRKWSIAPHSWDMDYK